MTLTPPQLQYITTNQGLQSPKAEQHKLGANLP